MTYLKGAFLNWRFAAVVTIYTSGYVAGLTEGIGAWIACVAIFVAGLYMLDRWDAR